MLRNSMYKISENLSHNSIPSSQLNHRSVIAEPNPSVIDIPCSYEEFCPVLVMRTSRNLMNE